MRGIKLSRYGGLSPVDYKAARSNRTDEHRPPCRKGIFAFIWPYMEMFFVTWHDRGQQEVIHHGIRNFTYDGPVWTHLVSAKEDPNTIEWNGAWREVSTDYLKALLRRVRHEANRALVKNGMQYCRKTWDGKYPTDPFCIGRSGFGMSDSRDYLEVFIAAKHLGRIR